jgi:Ino eighty subunit 1
MDVDEIKVAPAAPSAKDEPDSKQSPQDASGDPSSPKNENGDAKADPKASDGASKPTIWIQEPGKEKGAEERSVQSDSYSRAAEINPSHTMTVVHSRRNANGTIGSVYSGNKIRHLKKEDGVPLWREDIQYKFLRDVFEDRQEVFTLEGEPGKKWCFADIYIHAMAKSTKTSKVLREKLLADRDSALNMAMICLLVNVGRMNTTLNCKWTRSSLLSVRC